MSIPVAISKDVKKEMKPAPRETFGRGFLPSEFVLMRRFSDEMDRLFENFGFKPRFFEASLEEPVWSPDVEVFEQDKNFVVRADLPGLTKDEVKVGIVDDVLTLQGERKQEKETKRDDYYRSERRYGAFYRTIPLPENVKLDQVEAKFKDGVLEVKVPMAPIEQKRKTVEVKVG